MSASVTATTEDGMMSDSSTDSGVRSIRTAREKNLHRTRKTMRSRSRAAPQPRHFPDPLEHIDLMNWIRKAVVTSYMTSRMLVTHNSAGVPLAAHCEDEASRCGYKVAYMLITTLSRFGRASSMCTGHDAPQVVRHLIDALRTTLPTMSSTLADIASADGASDDRYRTAIGLFTIQCQAQAIHNTEYESRERVWVGRPPFQECLGTALMFASTRRSQQMFSDMLLSILPKLDRVLSGTHCPSEMLDVYIAHAKAVLNDANVKKGGGPYWVVRTDPVWLVNARHMKDVAFTLATCLVYLAVTVTITCCFGEG